MCWGRDTGESWVSYNREQWGVRRGERESFDDRALFLLRGDIKGRSEVVMTPQSSRKRDVYLDLLHLSPELSLVMPTPIIDPTQIRCLIIFLDIGKG